MDVFAGGDGNEDKSKLRGIKRSLSKASMAVSRSSKLIIETYYEDNSSNFMDLLT